MTFYLPLILKYYQMKSDNTAIDDYWIFSNLPVCSFIFIRKELGTSCRI